MSGHYDVLKDLLITIVEDKAKIDSEKTKEISYYLSDMFADQEELFKRVRLFTCKKHITYRKQESIFISNVIKNELIAVISIATGYEKDGPMPGYSFYYHRKELKKLKIPDTQIFPNIELAEIEARKILKQLGYAEARQWKTK